MSVTTFNWTNAPQSYIVPAGITSLIIAAKGASGASTGCFGGTGATVQGTLPVTPGETLQINVGGGGTTGQTTGTPGVGGFNGGAFGGAAHATGNSGSGAGGASDVRQGGTALANRVIIAGGGGGSSGSGTGTGGGGGALGGTAGAGSGGDSGGGGTQSAGGASSGTIPGSSGALGVGGTGSGTNTIGNGTGGGAGGYYGGGGAGFDSGTGANPGGGGGGSSFTAAGVTSTSSTAGTTGGSTAINPNDAFITITTVDTAPNAPTSLTPATGGFVDVTNAVVGWTFSDPDTSDFQAAADVRYRVQGALDWITVTAAAGTASSYQIFGLVIGVGYEWQVRTYDAQGMVGPYSASSFFTAKAHPIAVVTSPAPGQPITSLAGTPITWAQVKDQYAYTVRRVADDGFGNPDTSNVIETHLNSNASTTSVTFTTTTHNDGPEHWQLQVFTFSGQVVSDWVDVPVVMSVDAPYTPLCSVTAQPNAGSISVLSQFADMALDYFGKVSLPTVADTGQALTSVGAPDVTTRPGYLFKASTLFSQQATLSGKVLSMACTIRQDNLGTTTHTNSVYMIATDASNNAHIYCGIDGDGWFIKKNTAGTLATLASGALARPVTSAALNAYPWTMTATISGTTVTFVDISGTVHTATDAVIGSFTGTIARVQVDNTASNTTDDTWKVARWSASAVANAPVYGFIERSLDGVEFDAIPGSNWDSTQTGALFTFVDYAAPFNRRVWYRSNSVTALGALARSAVS